MQAQLRVVHKQANVQQVRLLSETVIGRSVDCNLKIASTQVSRRHCRVVVNELGVYVEDLCSANGTYLDGKRLLPNQLTLAPAGSQLVIGPATFAVEYRTSTVIRPELGASLPGPAAAMDVADAIETTSLPRADVEAALASSAPDEPQGDSPFAVIDSEPQSPVAAPSEQPSKRLRSLFGLFQRGSKRETVTAAPVPFLPTESEPFAKSEDEPDQSEVSQVPLTEETDLSTEVADLPPASDNEFAIGFDAAAEDSTADSDVDNPFRQFSQY